VVAASAWLDLLCQHPQSVARVASPPPSFVFRPVKCILTPLSLLVNRSATYVGGRVSTGTKFSGNRCHYQANTKADSLLLRAWKGTKAETFSS